MNLTGKIQTPSPNHATKGAPMQHILLFILTVAVAALALATQQTPWILGGFALFLLLGMSFQDARPLPTPAKKEPR